MSVFVTEPMRVGLFACIGRPGELDVGSTADPAEKTNRWFSPRQTPTVSPG